MKNVILAAFGFAITILGIACSPPANPAAPVVPAGPHVYTVKYDVTATLATRMVVWYMDVNGTFITNAVIGNTPFTYTFTTTDVSKACNIGCSNNYSFGGTFTSAITVDGVVKTNNTQSGLIPSSCSNIISGL